MVEFAVELTIRPARRGDASAVETFTADTWAGRGGDYVASVFAQWVEDDDAEAQTLIAEVDGRAIGLLRTVLLSPEEAWCGGLRVDPTYRGEGVALRLTDAGFEWARKQGASVARCMVFSWNTAGLGVARAAGFEPATEFRWAHPEPVDDQGAGNGGEVDGADGAWQFWLGSKAREHLGGLALDPTEPWALSSLSQRRLDDAADGGRLLIVGTDSGVHGVDVGGILGFTVRTRVTDREPEGDATDLERWAEYAIADWRDAAAARTVFDVIARDAASVGADRTRVLIPETARAVSDVAAARVALAESPNFVLAADLSR